MRKTYRLQIDDPKRVKNQLLQWSRGFEHVVWLDSNDLKDAETDFEAVLALGAQAQLVCNSRTALEGLQAFREEHTDWMFGYLGYDLKNEVERLSSENPDGLQFPDLHFIVPEKLIFVKSDRIEFEYLEEVAGHVESDKRSIFQSSESHGSSETTEQIRISLRTTKDTYFERFERIQQHLQRGDIYETNYCQEFFAKDTRIDPWNCYHKLNELAGAPFSTFLRFGDQFVVSSSPERYLQRKGNTVKSQPIKGTAKRGNTVEEDNRLKAALMNDPKERSENIMITDLVRNDLSHLALAGTVKVAALCELHSFKQVHQLISTVVAEVPEETSLTDLIKATFPMGSMTGAPKVAAMEIAEEVEDFKRGVYSGTVGYVKPNGDFDFNVVIRSILYNAALEYVSFAVGGAITAAANAADEYEECLLKAKAMRQVLEGNS